MRVLQPFRGSVRQSVEMKAMLALVTACGTALCSPERFARVGELEGNVEAQVHAADSWQTAGRNLPLVQSSWLRTGASARVETELDDGGVWRLAADSLGELSDYTRLSTGQLVTLISLDRGIAYFAGVAAAHDSLLLAVPGGQISIRREARVRLEAGDDWSQIAVLEGSVRFSSPAAEMELKEGQMVRVEPARPSRFFLYREISTLESDHWNDQRDKLLAASRSAAAVAGLHYGLHDLDVQGTWVDTPELGQIWRPSAADSWTPFQNGRWQWYDETGYTWIAAEPWGWLPYHYGRWVQQPGLGWAWWPGKSEVFKPGEVYWLREANILGWGPLAPGEVWNASFVPRFYLPINTSFARWVADASTIEPAEPAFKPKAPLSTALFVIAPPSPAFASARLDAVRPALRAGSTRIVPHLPGVTFEAPQETVEAAPPPSRIEQPPPPPQLLPTAPADLPAPDPVEIYYPVPVYTGIIVINPPENPKPAPKKKKQPQPDENRDTVKQPVS